jgi:hypothetical protein
MPRISLCKSEVFFIFRGLRTSKLCQIVPNRTRKCPIFRIQTPRSAKMSAKNTYNIMENIQLKYAFDRRKVADNSSTKGLLQIEVRLRILLVLAFLSAAFVPVFKLEGILIRVYKTPLYEHIRNLNGYIRYPYIRV